MVSLSTQLTNFATRLATEFKSHKLLINGNAADLSSLTTTAKSNLVSAINELAARPTSTGGSSGATISDSDSDANSSITTVSNSKVRSLIAAGNASLVNGAPGLLDTFKEFADALGNDNNFATTTATSLTNRLRVDAAQALAPAAQLQGRSNLDVFAKADIGTPDTDFVAVFNAGLS